MRSRTWISAAGGFLLTAAAVIGQRGNVNRDEPYDGREDAGPRLDRLNGKQNVTHGVTLPPVPEGRMAAYETWLPAEDEKRFAEWKKANAPKDSGLDYDWRGCWRSGDCRPDPVTGHWSDKWKKPNHPTFSTESVYYKFAKDRAGKWTADGQFIKPEGKGKTK